MIKIKTTRQKIGALITITAAIIHYIKAQREQLKYSLKRAELSAHLYIIEELSRKVRAKFILTENKPANAKLQMSFNEMEAYILMCYAPEKNIGNYELSVISEMKGPVFQHLLI